MSDQGEGKVLERIEIPEEGVDLYDAVNDLQRALIEAALKKTNGNRSEAAALIKLQRTTMLEKMKRLGIDQ